MNRHFLLKKKILFSVKNPQKFFTVLHRGTWSSSQGPARSEKGQKTSHKPAKVKHSELSKTKVFIYFGLSVKAITSGEDREPEIFTK